MTGEPPVLIPPVGSIARSESCAKYLYVSSVAPKSTELSESWSSRRLGVDLAWARQTTVSSVSESATVSCASSGATPAGSVRLVSAPHRQRTFDAFGENARKPSPRSVTIVPDASAPPRGWIVEKLAGCT